MKKQEPEEQIKERKETLEREQAKNLQLHRDREQLLKQPAFQRVMADLIARGGMFQSVMTGNSQTYHLSGKQDFTRDIWADYAKVNEDLAFDLLKPKFGENING
ncbi:MAG: hypothetical protein COB23_03160 [Methylophaga sp.]|nr:MAG: hypothetical protein COB23_03160 [Methylophaga sp.]